MANTIRTVVLLLAGACGATAQDKLPEFKKPTDVGDTSDKASLYDRARAAVEGRKDGAAEFIYLGLPPGSAPTPVEYEKAVKYMAVKGYSLDGAVPMKGVVPGKPGDEVPTLVFRHGPAKPKADAPPVGPTAAEFEEWWRQFELVSGIKDAKDTVGKLEKKPEGRQKAEFRLRELGGGDTDSASKLLVGLVRLKFGDGGVKKLEVTKGDEAVVVTARDEEGDKCVRWLVEQVKELNGQTPKK